jgi:hypothetical protein
MNVSSRPFTLPFSLPKALRLFSVHLYQKDERSISGKLQKLKFQSLHVKRTDVVPIHSTCPRVYSSPISLWAVFRPLAAGSSPRSPAFSFGLVRVTVVVEDVALGHTCLSVGRFSYISAIPLVLHITLSFILILFLSEGQAGEAWETLSYAEKHWTKKGRSFS